MEGAVLIVLAALFVAYANGANDNFKGAATLLGSGTTTDYRKALAWATVTTLAGSVTAFFVAEKLVTTFSGKGLVPDPLAASPEFLLAVACGAGATVLLATVTGMPISTTHSLTGALAGAGFMAVGTDLGFAALGKNFLIPLLFSPLFAVVLTAAVYPVFRVCRRMAGVEKSTCVCVGRKEIPVAHLNLVHGQAISTAQLQSLEIVVDETSQCRAMAVDRYSGQILGMAARDILNALHFLSAGAVSFARGLNDTPKIAALIVMTGALGLKFNIALVAVVMALGGLLSAKKVAQTMSYRITGMNHGQGFTANLVTALTVIFASNWGVPVSTTHVSCGALFGIGAVNGKARWTMIGTIMAAWALTLPVAAVFSGSLYYFLRG